MGKKSNLDIVYKVDFRNVRKNGSALSILRSFSGLYISSVCFYRIFLKDVPFAIYGPNDVGINTIFAILYQ